MLIDQHLLDKLEKTPDDITNPELTKLYLQFRSQFRFLSKRAKRVSRGSGGVESTGNRMYWASVLFTRLSVSSRSIEAVLPDPRPGQHWDFSAVASLVRNLLECYLLYYWLCEDDVAAEVRNARFIMLYLHDHGSRKRMFNNASANTDMDEEVTRDLTERFFKNPYLKQLPPGRQKDILRGERTPFIQDEVLERMGVNQTEFRWLYRFLSQHTHTGPVSFYRMAEVDRGAGVETRSEKVYMIMALSLANGFLESAISGHLKIFPYAEVRTPWISDSDVVKNVERAQGRSQRRTKRT